MDMLGIMLTALGTWLLWFPRRNRSLQIPLSAPIRVLEQKFWRTTAFPVEDLYLISIFLSAEVGGKVNNPLDPIGK